MIEVSQELNRIAELLKHESLKMAELAKTSGLSDEDKLTLGRTYLSRLHGKFDIPKLIFLSELLQAQKQQEETGK